MNKLRRVVNNTLISLIGQAVTWTSTFLLTIAYGRFLGDIKFGELYFAITFVGLIGFPIEFGFNQQLVRDIAQEPEPDKARRYLSNTIFIKLVLWAVLYSFVLLFCWLLNYSPEERFLVAICGVTLLCTATTNVFASLHYAVERNIFPVIGTVLEKGLTALFGFILLKYGAGVQVMAGTLLCGAFINTLCQAISFFRLNGMNLIIDTQLIRSLIRTSIPFLIYGVLGVIYYRLDTVLLSLMTRTANIGWYGAGYRLFDTLTFLPGIVIGAIMYPYFSKLSASSERDLKVAVEKTANFLLFSAFPIATLFIAAAPNIIGYLYHRSDFSNTIPVLRVLGPGLVFLYMNSVFSAILMSTKREKMMPVMAGIALVFNLALNLVGIPLYQQLGAAAVTSLTELLLLILSLFFIPRYLVPMKSFTVGLKCIGASILMAGVIWILRTDSILIILATAVPTYLTAALLLKAIPREDILAIYRAIRNKAQHSESELAELPAPCIMDLTNDEDTIPKITVARQAAFLADEEEDTLPRPIIPYKVIQVNKTIETA